VVVAGERAGAFTALFVGNGLSFLVAGMIVRRVLRRAADQDTPGRRMVPGSSVADGAAPRSPLRDRWFVAFIIGNGVLSLYDSLLLVFLPVWVITRTTLPPASVPILLAVNTAVTIALQVYVARFARGTEAALRLLVLSGGLMVVCCGFFAVAPSLATGLAMAAVTAAVLVLSLAENLHAVAAWELSGELAPPAARARYLGAFSFSFTGQKVAGSTLLLAVLLPSGVAGWPVLATAFWLAGVGSRSAARRALAERVEQHPAPNDRNESEPFPRSAEVRP
jgi:hypothetical protein